MSFISASESEVMMMGDWSSVHNQTGQCAPLLSPAVGTLKLVSGDGTSVGSVMSLQCPSRHRTVSGGQMSCVWSSNQTHWSGGTPECKPLSRFEDDGFRLAVLASFISLAIILVMCIIFITSCLVRHVKREERRKLERARKTGTSEFWPQIGVEGVEVQREVLHSQKTTNHHNNNNNNNNNNSGGERGHTDKHICSHGDLHTACRYCPNTFALTPYAAITKTTQECLDQGKAGPPSAHLSQVSVILSPPTDYLTNTLMGPVEARDAAGDRQVHDPLWNSPRPPPVHMMSV
ncbi:sushi domain-containing protein 3 [Carassius carassius]|uniref:sushi domain-containing protein 3 n=1 Tax=Carassius carassius TaxID=217509 RepID=UPI0028688231|nr:sushi domain-containing protein 3 [Carassius carassius]